jgi:hypothetical protein
VFIVCGRTVGGYGPASTGALWINVDYDVGAGIKQPHFSAVLLLKPAIGGDAVPRYKSF